jgi:radical SAM superfamily enzyme YgiQ (UPF0313 family)
VAFSYERGGSLRTSLIFVRDSRFFSAPSSKFLRKRKRARYPQGKKYYVLGEPPLGIMYLSSVLKEMGHQVSMTDQCHPEYSDEGFVDSLRRDRPEMIGISFLSNMCYPAARRLSRKIKGAIPTAKIVYGGVFPTINAREIVASEESVDIVARGEGEGIVRDLAQGLDHLGDIPGLTFRSRTGEVVETPDRDEIEDLDSIPFPDREGIDINYVASLPLDVPAVIWDRPYTSILSSRGCPFACTYCNCPTFSGKKCRARSAGNVLKELEGLDRKGYGAFTFVDDNFLLDPDRVTEICDGMIVRGHSFRWACEGRAEPKVNGIFEKLSKAGCDLVMFGIESGSQRILNGMNKRTKIVDIEKAVVHAKKAGIGTIHGFFIVGSPGETIEEVRQTFSFAEQISINSFNFNSLTAFRGTPLWRDAVARGLINENRDWDKMFPVHRIHPDTIDSQALFSLRSRLVRRLVRRKIMRNPREAIRILRRFLQCMSLRDIYLLLTSSKSEDSTQGV